MKLENMTWHEVEAHLKGSDGVILPVGSIEQHGPIGLIGTDAICAREIAWAAADRCRTIVAPELAYAPAPFNMGFPGTLSLSADLFEQIAQEVFAGLAHHGFRHIYVLNGHGANLDPLGRAAEQVAGNGKTTFRLRSWWDFAPVNQLRAKWYGDWEGMHATPSEISITQHTHGVAEAPDLAPPERLSAAYIRAHAGDRHGEASEHRAQFPDGRVGSHSGLARTDHGRQLLQAAAGSVAADYLAFLAEG